MISAPTIAFDYRPSCLIAGLTATLALAAVVAILVSGLAIEARIALAAVAAGYGGQAIYRYWRSPFHRIAYNASGWVLADRAGNEHSAQLVQHAILGALINLNFDLELKRRFAALVFLDNVDADTRRRLLLLLARGSAKSSDV